MLSVPLLSPVSLLALGLFILAYVFVMLEEVMHLSKCKPVMLSASLIWLICAYLGYQHHQSHLVQHILEANLAEYGQLLLFLLATLTYVTAMEEQNVFAALRYWLCKRNWSYRQLFWATGCLSFAMSPFIDNLTTALVLSSVVITLGGQQKEFITLSCINIVIAANAGGAFSPFGDITTLMVWQKGILPFSGFFDLFIPSLISFVVPAWLISFTLPKGHPSSCPKVITMSKHAWITTSLFALTLLITVLQKKYLHLPAAMGMMFGLSLLFWQGYYQKCKQPTDPTTNMIELLSKLEWDTLFFFYGVMISVAGLSCLGYLTCLSTFLYHDLAAGLAPTWQAMPANVVLGLLSAILDNIPMMYTILSMHPTMSEGQWLLVTLTSGIGGSLLAIGSAAGVAVMGQAKGLYTFASHLKKSWAILLGYFAAIITHVVINYHLF